MTSITSTATCTKCMKSLSPRETFNGDITFWVDGFGSTDCTDNFNAGPHQAGPNYMPADIDTNSLRVAAEDVSLIEWRARYGLDELFAASTTACVRCEEPLIKDGTGDDAAWIDQDADARCWASEGDELLHVAASHGRFDAQQAAMAELETDTSGDGYDEDWDMTGGTFATVTTYTSCPVCEFPISRESFANRGNTVWLDNVGSSYCDDDDTDGPHVPREAHLRDLTVDQLAARRFSYSSARNVGAEALQAHREYEQDRIERITRADRELNRQILRQTAFHVVINVGLVYLGRYLKARKARKAA